MAASRLTIEDGSLVVVDEERRRYRVLDLDEPRGRPPTDAEKAMPPTQGAPAPRTWFLDSDWKPRVSRRGPSSTW